MNANVAARGLRRRGPSLLFVGAVVAAAAAATNAARSSAIASTGSRSLGSKPTLVSTGLNNLGNTCYMNAQLECAFHIPAVRRIVIDGTPDPVDTLVDDSTAGDVDTPIDPAFEALPASKPNRENEEELPAADALRELFQQMETASQLQGAAVTPRSFCARLGIPAMVQQDSQEFWKLLLPAVGSETLTELYKGVFEDYITALDGSGRERRREEVYLDLSLDVASCSSVMESIQQTFGKPERLRVSEGNGWRPEKGAEKVDAHKGSVLVAAGLPPILQLHLKRFNYDWNTDRTTKLNKRFEFPKQLNLQSVVKKESSVDKSDSINDRTSYHLQSVVVHAGQYGAGHYYSYVRPDIHTDEWYRFNDNVVEKVDYAEVKRDAFGVRRTSSSKRTNGRSPNGPFGVIRQIFDRDGGGWGGRTSNAYVLQYVRQSDIPRLYPDYDEIKE